MSKSSDVTMSTSSSVGNNSKSVVCDKSCIQPLNICPKCTMPCHSRCAGKRLNSPCDLCRNTRQPTQQSLQLSMRKKPATATTTSTVRSTQSRLSHVQRVVPKKPNVANHPKGTSTPTKESSPRNSKAVPSSSLSASVSASVSVSASASIIDAASESATTIYNQRSLADTEVQAQSQTGFLQTQASKEDEFSVSRVAVLQASSLQLDYTSENAKPLPQTKTPGKIEDHIANLTGVTNVLIPVSTLEFLFQRFEALERKLDDLKSLNSIDSRHSSSSAVSTAPTETITVDSGELATRISALEKTITNQNNIINDVNNKCKLLLENNALLRDSLDKMQSAANSRCMRDEPPQNSDYIRKCVQCCEPTDLSDTSKKYTPSKEINSVDYSRELIISNIFEGSEKQNLVVLHAILSTILPTIEKDDIISARLLRSDKQISAGSRKTNSVKRRCPWVVRLSDRKIVKEIMLAKHKFTRFSTRDVNVSGLDQEIAENISNGKIFINEMLSKDKFAQYKSLKAVARGLQFKYFWHRGGRFLAKLRDGETTQLIVTAADLQAIVISTGTTRLKETINKNKNSALISLFDSKGDACASREANNEAAP